MREVSISTLITMYLIMLGPVKLILPFAFATANAEPRLKRRIAIKTFLVSSVTAFVVLLLGDFTVSRLLLSPGTLLIAMSFFLMSFAWNMAHVGDPARSATEKPPAAPTTELALFPIAFPGVIPPQGFALLVLSTQITFEGSTPQSLWPLIALTLCVMLANLVFMLAADSILSFTGHQVWLLVARFLSPLFVALGVHLLLLGLSSAGVISFSG